MLGIMSDLFVDVVILIASIALGSMLARDRVTAMNRKNGPLLGVLCGIQGCLLMLFGVRLAPDLMVDFRNIPVILMGLYSTFPAAILAALIIGSFRIAFFGWSTASLISLLVILLIGVACGLIGKLKWKQRYKWLLAFVAVCLISGTGFSVVVHDPVFLQNILFAYLAGMAIITILTYFVIKYIQKSNARYYLLKESSIIDYLTGLHNVRYFDKTLNDMLAYAKENGKSVSLLFIDIDFFKKVNDSFGHLNGDSVLKELADMLQQQSRSIDVVTRYGGEEFTLLLNHCGLNEAIHVAERIRLMVEDHDFLTREKETIKITVSIGVSSFPETTPAVEKLIEQADIALYTAKRAGRNCVSIAQTDNA